MESPQEKIQLLEARVAELTRRQTEFVKTEQQLRESEAKFRALAEESLTGVYLIQEGRFVYANRAEAAILGYTVEELLALPSVMLTVAEEDRAKVSENIARRMRGEAATLQYEFTSLRKDGSRCVVEVIGTLTTFAGKPAILGTSRDISETRAIHRQLEESEGRYRTLVEHIPNCVVAMLDEDLRFVFVGGSGLEALGLRAQDLVGRRVDEIVSPAQMALLRPAYAAAWQGETRSFEFEFRSDAIFYSTTAPLRDGDGKIRQLVTNSINITSRKLAEIQIQRLNRTYALMSGINELIVRERDPRRILDHACKMARESGEFLAAWVGLRDAASGMVKLETSAGMDDAALEIVRRYLWGADTNCHITHEAVSEKRPTVCNDIANDPGAGDWQAEALKRGFRSMASLPLLRRDQLIGVFNLYSGVKDFFDDPELRLLWELAADISFAIEICDNERDRQNAAEQLRVSEERFRALIENVSDVITVINYAGVIRFQSPSVTKLLGYEPEEMLGKSALEFIYPDDAGSVGDAILRCVQNPNLSISVEYRMQHKNATWQILHSIGRSVLGLAEEGFIVVASRDITETRRLEEQLRQSQKMEAIGQLAGGVAHDFNNILAAMMMQSELMLDHPDLSEEMNRGLRDIRAAAERGANLTRQLLLFSRRQVLQPRILNLNDIVTSLSNMLQRIIGEDVQLQIHLNSTPVIVRADPGMIDQVLMNLAVNARDAMPQGGRLVIQTTALSIVEPKALLHGELPPGRYAGFSVSDTGEGIAAEIMPRIFEPFFTTKEAGKGTGLGLATVFGIIKQHNGWIDVKSQPGNGASFRIYLPASEFAAAEGAGATSDLPRGHEGILVVEDEPGVRALTRVMLKRHGYTVFEAANGAEALKIWEEKSGEIDLLLTDVIMPGGMSGRQLAIELQNRRPTLRVIYASGYSAEFVGRELQPELGESFLQKPFSQRDLLIAVRRQLDWAKK